MSVPGILSDLERGQKFLADLHNYDRTVWPRMTRIWHDDASGVKQISRGQPRPHPKEAGSQRPQKFIGLLTYPETLWPTATTFDMVTWGSVFLGRHPRPRPWFYVHLVPCLEPYSSRSCWGANEWSGKIYLLKMFKYIIPFSDWTDFCPTQETEPRARTSSQWSCMADLAIGRRKVLLAGPQSH